MPSKPPERLTYCIDEVAKVLGVGRNQAYLAARSGQLPTIRIGKRILVPRVALTEMLSNAHCDEAARSG